MKTLTEFFEQYARTLNTSLEAIGLVPGDKKLWTSIEMRGDNETVTTYLFRGKPILQTRLYFVDNAMRYDIYKPE